MAQVEATVRSIAGRSHHENIIPTKSAEGRNYVSTGRSLRNNNNDARSIHTERHYDRTVRSNRSQELRPTERQSVRSQGSARANSQRSSSSRYQYARLSTSNVSDPNNLVCDGCINHQMAEQKRQISTEELNREKDYMNRLNDHLKKQLEDEKRLMQEKKLAYYQAIDGHNSDILAKKRNQKAAELAADNELLQTALRNDQAWVQDKAEKDYQKKRNLLSDLKQQLEDRKAYKHAENMKKKLDEDCFDNVLIRDDHRQQHNEAVKNHYRGILQAQMNDKAAEKNQHNQQKLMEDDYYKKAALDMAEREDFMRKDLDQKKRKLFQEDIANQLNERDQLREYERQAKLMEDENFRRKIAQDEQADMDNLFRRKKQVEQYLNSLGDQMQDDNMKKQIAKEEANKAYLGTLNLPQKHTKCYNCKCCHGLYPLKMLNKKKKLVTEPTV